MIRASKTDIPDREKQIPLVGRRLDKIESSVEGASAIQIGRDFLDGGGFKTGKVLFIKLEEREPNFYWDYALKYERPDLTGLRTCWVIRFEQKQRPGHFFEVWIDASENIVIGGSQCR